MDYEKKYKEALEKARQLCAYPTTKPFISDLQDLFPELKESKVGKPNGGIVSEDFNEGDGFYKVNLAYLSKEQVEEIESLVKKWNPESDDERIRKELTDYIKRKFENSCSPTPSKNILGNWIAWLEKQGKETSWKPSKEEMDVLYGLAYITNQYDEHKEEVITRLYQDLKREFFNGASYENMFPTHSIQDDVRRRSTIQVLEYARSLDTYNQYGKADIDKNIAWLEKQGEQKTNDIGFKAKDCYVSEVDGKIHIAGNFKPKFRDGDWIIFNGLTLYIKEVVQGYYRTITIDNVPNSYDWDIDNAARLWTIKEVKNGDVLKEDSCVFIVERINPNGTARVHCCLFDDGEFDLTGSTLGFDIDSTHPATKEQRDLLFQKIKEANHKWDADKKELIKL